MQCDLGIVGNYTHTSFIHLTTFLIPSWFEVSEPKDMKGWLIPEVSALPLYKTEHV